MKRTGRTVRQTDRWTDDLARKDARQKAQSQMIHYGILWAENIFKLPFNAMGYKCEAGGWRLATVVARSSISRDYNNNTSMYIIISSRMQMKSIKYKSECEIAVASPPLS